MCFVDLQKAFDRVQREVLESVMRKKGILEAKTKVRVDSDLSEEPKDKVGMHQRSVLSPFCFAVVVDVFAEFAREV